MRQYSIDRVIVTWAGLDFSEGLAAGTSITETRTAPSWTIKPTGYGKVVRVFNPDRSGTITCLVDQESALHQALRALALSDVGTRAIVFDMIVKDTSSGEQFTYENCFIQTEPDEVRGTESSVFSWVFFFETFLKTIVTPLTNAVGN